MSSQPVPFGSTCGATDLKVITPPAPFPRKLPHTVFFEVVVIVFGPFVGFVIRVVLLIIIVAYLHLRKLMLASQWASGLRPCSGGPY